MSKQIYKKGLEFFNKNSKEKILFGAWNADNTATCLTVPKNEFIRLTREELDQNYVSYSSLQRQSRDQRRGQCW